MYIAMTCTLEAGVAGSRTAAEQDGDDLWRRSLTPQQFLGDPLIGDAPVGLWEVSENPQPVQPIGNSSCGRGGCSRVSCVRMCGR